MARLVKDAKKTIENIDNSIKKNEQTIRDIEFAIGRLNGKFQHEYWEHLGKIDDNLVKMVNDNLKGIKEDLEKQVVEYENNKNNKKQDKTKLNVENKISKILYPLIDNELKNTLDKVMDDLDKAYTEENTMHEAIKGMNDKIQACKNKMKYDVGIYYKAYENFNKWEQDKEKYNAGISLLKGCREKFVNNDIGKNLKEWNKLSKKNVRNIKKIKHEIFNKKNGGYNVDELREKSDEIARNSTNVPASLDDLLKWSRNNKDDINQEFRYLNTKIDTSKKSTLGILNNINAKRTELTNYLNYKNIRGRDRARLKEECRNLNKLCDLINKNSIYDKVIKKINYSRNKFDKYPLTEFVSFSKEIEEAYSNIKGKNGYIQKTFYNYEELNKCVDKCIELENNLEIAINTYNNFKTQNNGKDLDVLKVDGSNLIKELKKDKEAVKKDLDYIKYLKSKLIKGGVIEEEEINNSNKIRNHINKKLEADFCMNYLVYLNNPQEHERINLMKNRGALNQEIGAVLNNNRNYKLIRKPIIQNVNNNVFKSTYYNQEPYNQMYNMYSHLNIPNGAQHLNRYANNQMTQDTFQLHRNPNNRM